MGARWDGARCCVDTQSIGWQDGQTSQDATCSTGSFSNNSFHGIGEAGSQRAEAAAMRQSKHDELRALRSRLPVGMLNPRDLAGHSMPVAEQEVELDDHASMVMRVAQLVSLQRTSLAHMKFGALHAKLVLDTSEEGAEAWSQARATVLSGAPRDGKDALRKHGMWLCRRQ